ncbi:MAG: SGNH/GDSL hydrolase family protein [Pirellulaceae bacterium]|nr:SGNH/GDSL hydrolase family protein [Pirellulaceae bacterium]
MISKYFVPGFVLCWLAVTQVADPAVAQSPIQPGDRIAIVGNTFADQLRIHGYLETLLLQHTIDNPVSIRNLGWGGDMLTARDRPTGFPSESSTLTAHSTDVIIACFGMGESFAGETGVADFKRRVEAFIKMHAGQKYNGNSDVRLILVSPIACEDLGELTPEHQARNRDLRSYAQAMQEVAAASNLPMVDLFEASRYLMEEPAGPKLTRNGIHLKAYGYWAISHSFFGQPTSSERAISPRPWTLSLDFSAATAEAEGVEITALREDADGLSFQVTERSFPSLPPPTSQSLPPQLEFRRDTLTVANLPPGSYELTVDGQPVARADAKTWAIGVAIDASPAHREWESYRAAVNDKNLQFTYSWKALNQVHIVGERKQSPSGKELPKEVIEFDRLAHQREEALRKGVQRKSRQWRISRIGNE